MVEEYEHQIARLLEEYVDRIRAGEEPSIEEYLSRNHKAASPEVEDDFYFAYFLEDLLAKYKAKAELELINPLSIDSLSFAIGSKQFRDN